MHVGHGPVVQNLHLQHTPLAGKAEDRASSSSWPNLISQRMLAKVLPDSFSFWMIIAHMALGAGV